MKCAVCEKHKTLETLPGGAIFKDNNIFVAHFPLIEQEKAHRGHIILELCRHITDPAELVNDETTMIGMWIQKISLALKKVLQAEHVYITRIGDKTPHLHFHFVPRYANTPQEFYGPLHHTWPDGPKADANEMISITNAIKTYLKV